MTITRFEITGPIRRGDGVAVAVLDGGRVVQQGSFTQGNAARLTGVDVGDELRVASIEMPGLLPYTSVKSLIPPRWYAMLYPPRMTESPGAPNTACCQPSL